MSQNLINSLTDDVSALRAHVNLLGARLARAEVEAAGHEVRAERALGLAERANENAGHAALGWLEEAHVVSTLAAILVDEYANQDSYSREDAVTQIQNIVQDARTEHRAKQEQSK